MSMRPCLRTGSLLVGGMLVLAVTACGGGDPGPARWDLGSASASAEPSSSVDATPTATAPATTGPTQPPSAPATKKTTPPPATGGARVSVARVGGLAGVSQTLTVEADGRWTYQERTRGGTTQSGKLAAGQRQQLQGLLADPALPREGGAHATCADGFAYAVSTGSTTVFWRDCGSGEPKTAGAIVRLLTGSTPL